MLPDLLISDSHPHALHSQRTDAELSAITAEWRPAYENYTSFVPRHDDPLDMMDNYIFVLWQAIHQ